MDKIGFKIDLPPNAKLTSIKLPDEVLKQLGLNSEHKSASNYLQEFLGSEALYNDFNQQFTELAEKSLPENLECEFCSGKSTLVEDKACTRYYRQMEFTLFIATTEFVQIVLNNKHIFKDDSNAYQRLAKHFINSLRFVKGEGFLWLDLGELIRLILSEGFVTLSNEFGSSDTLHSLQVINNTLDDLNSRELYNELHNRVDQNFIPIQRKFFASKQAYLKENLQLEELQFTKRKPQHKHTIDSRPDRTDIALFAYYMSETGNTITSERFPSVKAWKEIGSKYNRNYKNIQQKYNEIRIPKNRITKRNCDSIQYVIDNMLNDYPNAKSLALDELKLAKLK